jgi:hypothetical protein
MQCLNFEILKNGNLAITATKDGIELISESNNTHNDTWWDLLEYTSCNGSYTLVEPHEVGALTDSPIIAENIEYDEIDGKLIKIFPDKIWWFPEYCIIDELEKLKNGETIEFTLAEKW